jgi:uncharacterized protein
LRGWSKEDRRAIIQIFNWTILAAAFCLQMATGLIHIEVLWLALVAFPGTVIGAWLGARAYHALSDQNFRDVVLGLLFLSGIGLVWSSLGAH